MFLTAVRLKSWNSFLLILESVQAFDHAPLKSLILSVPDSFKHNAYNFLNVVLGISPANTGACRSVQKAVIYTK